MILVDTSVWIDFFAGRDLPHVSKLEQLIRDNENLALCGIVLTEILQGITDDADYRRVRRELAPLLMLPMTEEVFVQAADIYPVPAQERHHHPQEQRLHDRLHRPRAPLSIAAQ